MADKNRRWLIIFHSSSTFSSPAKSLLIVFSFANSSSGCVRQLSTLPDKLPARGSHARHRALLRHNCTAKCDGVGGQDGAAGLQSEEPGQSNGKRQLNPTLSWYKLVPSRRPLSCKTFPLLLVHTSSARNHSWRHYLKCLGHPLKHGSRFRTEKTKGHPASQISRRKSFSDAPPVLLAKKSSGALRKSPWASFIERFVYHAWGYKWWGFVTQTARSVMADWLIDTGWE